MVKPKTVRLGNGLGEAMLSEAHGHLKHTEYTVEHGFIKPREGTGFIRPLSPFHRYAWRCPQCGLVIEYNSEKWFRQAQRAHKKIVGCE